MRLIICFFLRSFLEVPLGNTRHTMGRKKRGSNTGSPMTTPFFEHEKTMRRLRHLLIQLIVPEIKEIWLEVIKIRSDKIMPGIARASR